MNGDAERLDRLRLARTENVGPVTFLQLLDRYGSAGTALDVLPDLAARGGRRRPLRLYPRDDAERERAVAEALGARQIVWGDPDYPVPLAAIPDPPPVLTVLGDAALPQRHCVAIVGARNASLNGRKLAERLAADLAASGVVVVSGFARGIDTAAHRGALSGGTAAVMAGGCDVVYPPENESLYAAVCRQGAVLSEVPPGEQPQARHFPRRNRIISGLCAGVVVVEAAQRSGSLITARLAGEQGREVFAVPGSPLDPRCRGTNDLIRKGATLVESAEDVLDALHGFGVATPHAAHEPATAAPVVAENAADTSAAHKRVEELLGAHPIAADDLIRASGLPAALVWSVLLELELAGFIDRYPGNRVARAG